jgi:hypothetical protein
MNTFTAVVEKDFDTNLYTAQCAIKFYLGGVILNPVIKD